MSLGDVCIACTYMFMCITLQLLAQPKYSIFPLSPPSFFTSSQQVLLKTPFCPHGFASSGPPANKSHDVWPFVWLLPLIMMSCIYLTVFVNALSFPEMRPRVWMSLYLLFHQQVNIAANTGWQ